MHYGTLKMRKAPPLVKILANQFFGLNHFPYVYLGGKSHKSDSKNCPLLLWPPRQASGFGPVCGHFGACCFLGP